VIKSGHDLHESRFVEDAVMPPRIESMLSARLFLVPQLAGDRIYFVSNMSGHLSLYAMDHGGSVPEPLLPPDVVLQNPHLIGNLFRVFPGLSKILILLDDNGDENYQPVMIPLEGGMPEPIFAEQFAGYRVHMSLVDVEKNTVYFSAESRTEQMNETYRANLETGELTFLGKNVWGNYPGAKNDDHSKVILLDGYSAGDVVLYLWEVGKGDRQLLMGKPLEARAEGEQVPPNGIFALEFVNDDTGLLCGSTVHDDAGSAGYIDLANPAEIKPVAVTGVAHTGRGEMTGIDHLDGDRYQVSYNIDGCSWVYEGTFDAAAMELKLQHVIVGQGELAGGVLESIHYDKATDRYALSFSTATSPTQIYTVEGEYRAIIKHTRERVLGIPQGWLSAGEDASFTSFDGLRVSARLYLPAQELGFRAPHPLVYYIHGGPQSQERPDFAWFSMPLIQFLTINGFAVFVPNVRGSSGYGMSYMKQVDRDWGGQDRLDHVHAMTEVLPHDSRLNTKRTAVVGRSYGGYMTLTLAGRHPELWKAACDMFGPYDLLTFMERIPETWKPYFKVAVGDPEKDLEFLVERSPKTYLGRLGCPMLVIQGKNDPRVIEQESRDVVENLRGEGKQIDYLMFEDEGHDVLKFNNRVTVYNAITDFFKKHLMA
jgi:pimeloyl-ACP methyl ester carboxylesterase